APSRVAEHPAVRPAVAVLVLALATLALHTAWVSRVAWPILLVGALLGLGCTLLARRIGLSFAVTLLIVVTVPLLGLVLSGRTQQLSPLEAITDSIPILLTSAFPAPLTPVLLGPGLALTWLAGALLGTGLQAGRFLIRPLIVGAGLLIAAALLTAGRADRFGLIGFGIVAVLVWHWARRMAPAGGSLGSAVPAVGIGALALLLAHVPLGTPFQPRDLVESPVIHLEEPNPLPLLGQWARNPDGEILRRSGHTAPLRLAVLPDYDGVSFGSNSVYRQVGTTDQPDLPPGRFQVTLDAAVTWRTTTRWLPTPGQPVSVAMPNNLPAPLVDVDTGSLLLQDLPPDGVVSYSVTGRVDAARLAEVEGADVATEPRYLAVPVLPPEFVEYAREVTDGAQSYLQIAQALETALASGRAFDANAPGGSSLGRLSDFLFLPRERGGRTGTSEQFATAYVLLARSVGLPSRVVVGFGDGEPLADNPDVRVVRGRDALAWPEVYFSGYGWVAFDPTPNPEGSQTQRPGRLPPQAERTEEPTPPPLPPPPPPNPPGRAGQVLWPLFGLLVLFAPIGVLAWARRRRTRDQQAQGVIGAWRRVEDAIVLAGLRTDRTRSAPERAAALGVPEAVTLANQAEQVAFGPAADLQVPVAQTVPDPSRSARGWDLAEEVVRQLRAPAARWRRAVWAINPAVWRSRSRR
ncbi:MAG: transglutaminase-like domain-containing protein, partial [Propionibacteriaceae bacterium]|nr:transglutaminase-like domain-containing protein [Propionibacteriaceae bacterium]